ncbi:uncharacterized protein LOC110035035 [Phalaenopsis equestris]|uniref:uncharacterized protein LOC110035035 n=2 Tax=Phalaenopsis equestris TaxID=78828 RepID=UPI0009E47EA0|nr:uncharacterized protein LOC110035035 [Phalaenopsis equestris]
MENQFPLLLLLLLSSSTLTSQSPNAAPNPSPAPIKAVNLGGWLVTEGWITPNLFDEIPINNDLLDGTQIQLKSITKNSYLSTNSSVSPTITANQSSPSEQETFRLWRITETMFQFRVFNWRFFELDEDENLVAISASSNDSDSSHTFEVVRNNDDRNRIRIKAPNGSFLEVKPDGLVKADCSERTDWGDEDPSIFLLTNVKQLQGEFQVTNGYGTEHAPAAMMKHWKNFIVKDDFKFMSENGLNAVRVPVGWWIRFDQSPPHPFVGGSLQALDNAFSWAE